MKKMLILFCFGCLVQTHSSYAQVPCIEELESISIPHSYHAGIAVKDHYLYVTDGYKKLIIYDILNLESPKRIKEIDYALKLYTKVDVQGNYLYLYQGQYNDLSIFDITNPVEPIKVSELQLSPNNNGNWNTCYYTNYMYLTSIDTLFVVNLSDKLNPFIANSISFSPGMRVEKSLFANSKALYLGANEGILIFDNSNPLFPEFQDVYEGGHNNFIVDTTNKLLYASHHFYSNQAHYVSDISKPLHPKLVFEGNGGGVWSGIMHINKGILMQTSHPFDEEISLYHIQGDSTVFIKDIQIKKHRHVIEIAVTDSAFLVALDNEIKILRIGCKINEVLLNEKEDIRLYPNPVSHTLNLKMDNERENMEVKIINDQGKLLAKKRLLNKHEVINVRQFSAGLYVMQIAHNGKIILSQKIVKQ